MMNWYHTAYFISIMVTAAVMGYIAWYSRRHRDSTPGSGVYMWVSLMVSLSNNSTSLRYIKKAVINQQ